MNFKILVSLAAILVLSGCATLSEVDQALGQATEGLATTDRVTGQRVLGSGDRVSQIKEANAAIDEAIAKGKAKGMKFNAELDAVQFARLERIVQRILPVTHFADEATQWRVWLVPDPEWNAYVVGGTYIMVNKGFVDDKAMSDDDIAAVIGHEIAHVAANHISERKNYQLVAGLGTNSSSRRESFSKSYGMAQEEEADKIGILYAALAGFNPESASVVWQRQFQKSGNGGAFVSSHPFNSERAKQTKAIAAQVIEAGYYNPGKTNPNAQGILKDNVLWQYRPNTAEAGKGGGSMAVIETVMNAYIQREQAKLVEAQQLARKQRIETTLQAIRILGTKAIDANTVQVGVSYKGYMPLSSFVMWANTPSIQEGLISKAEGIIQPNTQFILTFTKEGLTAEAKQMKFGVDDVTY